MRFSIIKSCCFFFLLTTPLLFSQPQSSFDIEIVESTPIGTMLENEDIRNASDVWKEMIDKSKHTIEIEQFYISDEPGKLLGPVLSSIYRAADRGVQVRVIVDARMYSTYPNSVDSLEKYPNIETRRINFGSIAGGIQHSKFFIIDSAEIFVGSQNFDWRALEHIHELGLRINNKKIAAAFSSIFNYDWKVSAGEPADPSFVHIITPSVPVLDGRSSYAAVTPTFSPKGFIPDSALWDETQILSVINNAKETLTLQFLGYSTNERRGGSYTVIDDAVRAAAKRGVNVKLIVADWEKGSSGVKGLQELSVLPNIQVAFSVIPEWTGGYVSFARVEHCKYITADTTMFWLGTSNCEKNYFYNTRNLGIVAESPLLAKRLHKIFMKSWDSSYMERITPDGKYEPRQHGEKE